MIAVGGGGGGGGGVCLVILKTMHNKYCIHQ
jgi:hypothetical protein